MLKKEMYENSNSTCLVASFRFTLIFFLFSVAHQLDGDDRSDEEEDDSDSLKETNQKLSHTNGSGARGRASGH